MAKWDNDPAVTPRWANDPKHFGIDFDQPINKVRDALKSIPATDRPDALRQWADHFVASERQQGGLGQSINNAARTVARGSFVGPYLDEAEAAIASGMHKLTGGAAGAPYDEAVAYQRAKDRAVDANAPIASFAAKVAGGVAGGGAALKAVGAVPGIAGALAGGPLAAITPAASIAGKVAQGAGVGGAYGAAQGFGAGEETLTNRIESAATGGLLGAGLGGVIGGAAGTVGAVRQAAAGQGQTGAYNRFAGQIEDGVDTFANQVATGAARNTQNIQRRTLDILGEEMERAGGDRIPAVQNAVARISRETGVAPATAREQIRRLSAVHAESPLLMAEYPAVAQSNAAVRATRNPATADVQEIGRVRDSGAHFIIDDLANQAGAGSSSTVRNAVNDRNLGIRDVMRDRLGDMAPRAPGGAGPRTIHDLDQMQEGARRAASMEYQAAYQAPTNNRLLLGMLPRILDRHSNRMAGRSGEQAQALRGAINEFMITRPNGQTIPMMGLQQLQDARQALRNQITRAREADGQAHVVATLQPLYNDVTRLMERANPTWARANQRWADNAIDTVGRRLGEAFSLKAGPQYRRQLREYERLAPEAQSMVQVEFLQKMADKLDNIGDTHDVAKLFATDHMRAAVRSLFGDRAVVDLTMATRDAATATRSGRMLGNSATAMRLARRADSDAETGIQAAADMASVRGIRNAILERLTRIVTERRNQPLAEIATTPMRDTAAVARHIHNMRAAQRYQSALRQPSPQSLQASSVAGGIAGQETADLHRGY